MPLESCMILLDNSEYMRNGDYIPTRLEAQIDAANMLVGAKTQAHPESTVGVSAGTELLVSPTEDVAKILKAIHRVLPVTANDEDEDDHDIHNHHGNKQGHFHTNMFVLQADATSTTLNNNINTITASVQVANLALKHRKNKNGLQRIILFVGTPLTGVDSKALIKAGKQLKKNNVMIDVVALGELEINEPKLQELVDAANGRTASNSNDAAGSDRTCHLVTVPPGTLPSDVLASSPILAADGGAYAAAVGAAAAGAYGGVDGGSGAAANPFADFGGVDPNMDPELAMALRVSMEEERVRQERAAAAATSSSGGGGEESKDAEMTDAAGGATAAAAGAGEDALLDEEEALLQQALAMSMQENEPKSAAAESEEQQHDDDNEDAKFVAAAMMETDEIDDAAMQMALQMSMQQEEETSMSEQNQQQQLQDPAFVQELLGSMPGVDPNDPEIQKALREAAAKKKQDDDKKKKKDQNK